MHSNAQIRPIVRRSHLEGALITYLSSSKYCRGGLFDLAAFNERER